VNKTFLNRKFNKILKQRSEVFLSYSEYMFAEWLEGNSTLPRKKEGVMVANCEMLPVLRNP
jgi:hypothetical protein